MISHRLLGGSVSVMVYKPRPEPTYLGNFLVLVSCAKEALERLRSSGCNSDSPHSEALLKRAEPEIVSRGHLELQLYPPPFTNITSRIKRYWYWIPWNDQKSGHTITGKIPGNVIAVELPEQKR